MYTNISPGYVDKCYAKIHSFNVNNMKDLNNKINKESGVNNEDIWNELYSCYIDPDSKAIRKKGDINCNADGLISIRRIFKKFGLSNQTISDYERYRKVPIIFFPPEINGINTRRNFMFGDRIDHTLFDLKNYWDNQSACRLTTDYDLPKTNKWLNEFNSFKALIDWCICYFNSGPFSVEISAENGATILILPQKL